MPTREDVIAEVHRTFPTKDPADVLAILEQYGPDFPERERIQLTILRVSKGNLQAVRDGVSLANTDYRDVLAIEEEQFGTL